MAQCEGVAELLRTAGFEVETILVDPAEERRLAGKGDKSRFTHGVEKALLEGRADIGVHSAKDLPGELADGLLLAGAPGREVATDAWITPQSAAAAEDRGDAAATADRTRGDAAAPADHDRRARQRDLRERLAALAPGARVGTASLRRQSQLLALRGDLVVEELRGNVDTRLRLLRERQLDAIVLATAGLKRLGLEAVAEAELNPGEMLPAPGQGVLALEAREGDTEALAAAEAITCEATFTELRAERAVSAGLAADCDTPIGALATVSGDRLRIDGYVGRGDGSDWIRDRLEGPSDDPKAVGGRLAERMIAAGALTILGRS